MSGPVRKREIFGWCCYDFANSAFITVVITVVYGPYFTGVVAAGWAGANTLWSVTLAASQVVVMVFGPALGVLADVTASKKKFLLSMMWVCSAATAALWLTGPGTVALAAGLVIVAYAAFSFGENFCASFLSELSTPENCGRISGYGWSFGYLGGLGALGLAMLVLSVSPDGVRWVFVVTALFMVAATLPVLLLLRERKQPEPHVARWWQLGWESVLRAARDLPQHRDLLRFFWAFLLYMSGLGAVVAFAAIYSEQVLGFTTAENLVLFASLQISSALGALAFGWWQDRAGSVNMLTAALLLWCLVAVGGLFLPDEGNVFSRRQCGRAGHWFVSGGEPRGGVAALAAGTGGGVFRVLGGLRKIGGGGGAVVHGRAGRCVRSAGGGARNFGLFCRGADRFAGRKDGALREGMARTADKAGLSRQVSLVQR